MNVYLQADSLSKEVQKKTRTADAGFKAPSDEKRCRRHKCGAACTEPSVFVRARPRVAAWLPGCLGPSQTGVKPNRMFDFKQQRKAASTAILRRRARDQAQPDSQSSSHVTPGTPLDQQ